MLDIAICEDDRYQQGELEEKLYAMGKRLGICLEVYVYERGESLLAEIQRGTQYDMVYLDIELGGMSGISLAEELRKKDRTLQIVYVTQYEGYIKKSIDTMPSGYIVKPIKEDELEAVFQRVSSWILGKDDYYRFVSDKIPCKVLLKDTLYFKSNLRQAEIVCESQNYVIYKKLDQIELELAETYKKQFLRIHQSYIVNYNFVSRFGHNWVELNTGHCLPMSRKRREDIENKLGRM